MPTQGSKPGLLHCRPILYCLSHQGRMESIYYLNLPLSDPKSDLSAIFPFLVSDSIIFRSPKPETHEFLPSFHFCPKARFFPHSQCYSRFHFFRKSTRTNPSLLPNAATFALRWACLLPHSRPPVSRGLCQGSAWEVSSLRCPQGPVLQSTGADAD